MSGTSLSSRLTASKLCMGPRPSTHRARSYSSSDDDLLPIEVLRPWLYKGPRSPQKSRYLDPAEDALPIPPRTARKIKSASSSRQSSASVSPEPAASVGRSKHNATAESRKEPVASTSSSKDNDDGFHRTNSASGSLEGVLRRPLVVPDSETELDFDDQVASLLVAHTPTASAKQALTSNTFAQEWATPAPKPYQITPRPVIDLSTPEKVAPTSSKPRGRDKSRRLTIITIPDSDEEADQPPSVPSTPGIFSPPALVRSLSFTSTSGDNTPEEVSFADYSDKEDDLEQAIAPKIIDLDSSDSDYDAASGVLTWQPTPNKTKPLPSVSRKPLTAIPGYLAPPSTIKKVTPIKPRPKPSSSEEGGPSRSIHSPPVVKAKDTPKTAKKAPAATPHKAPKTTFAKDRDALAQTLVEELDETVFKGRLPADLTIVWNGRLNTTAGRASWKKLKAGSTGKTTYEAKVELSVKVIDCHEKLKCTLAHELCHIAAWAVEGEMKPAHGPAFKDWGRKIMAVRKDITVTTRHSYEIAYKFNWQCTTATCGKVYGRHSKSIDPQKHACGICSGRLVQLDKDGNPLESGTSTPRKESEYQAFAKGAFKRLKAANPTLGMTDVNKLVAEEWRAVKADRASAPLQSLGRQLELLEL